MKYYESAADSLRNRIEEAGSPEARFDPSDAGMMDKSMKELARRIETIDTVSSSDHLHGNTSKEKYDGVERCDRRDSETRRRRRARRCGPREGETVEDLKDSVMGSNSSSSTGGALKKKKFLLINCLFWNCPDQT